MEKTTPKPSPKKTTNSKQTKKGGAYDQYNKGKNGGGVKKKNPKQ